MIIYILFGLIISEIKKQINTFLNIVFIADFNGRIKVNSSSYHATAGKLTLRIPAGFHEITKGDVANLYYMSVDYGNFVSVISPEQEKSSMELTLYPNPPQDFLRISIHASIRSVEIYSLSGILLQRTGAKTELFEISRLNRGSYIVKVLTPKGTFNQLFIKN